MPTELATRCDRVVALDASHEMIRVAEARSPEHANVEYRCVDFDRFEAPPRSFDAVVSVATLHHLPLRPSLARLRDWLAPGGSLLILDLGWPAGLNGLAQRALAFPASVARRFRHTRRVRRSREARAAWKEHAAHDEYPAWNELGSAARELLPGHRLERHLFWRYSLVWRAPRDRAQPARGVAVSSPPAWPREDRTTKP